MIFQAKEVTEKKKNKENQNWTMGEIRLIAWFVSVSTLTQPITSTYNVTCELCVCAFANPELAYTHMKKCQLAEHTEFSNVLMTCKKASWLLWNTCLLVSSLTAIIDSTVITVILLLLAVYQLAVRWWSNIHWTGTRHGFTWQKKNKFLCTVSLLLLLLLILLWPLRKRKHFIIFLNCRLKRLFFFFGFF